MCVCVSLTWGASSYVRVIQTKCLNSQWTERETVGVYQEKGATKIRRNGGKEGFNQTRNERVTSATPFKLLSSLRIL